MSIFGLGILQNHYQTTLALPSDSTRILKPSFLLGVQLIRSQKIIGRGVIPDIPVTREKALDTAYKMALETVIEGIKEPSSRPLNKLLKEAQEALEAIIN